MKGRYICSSGKARPRPSASRTGKPGRGGEEEKDKTAANTHTNMLNAASIPLTVSLC